MKANVGRKYLQILTCNVNLQERGRGDNSHLIWCPIYIRNLSTASIAHSDALYSGKMTYFNARG